MFVVSEVFKGFKAWEFSKSNTLKELAVSKHVFVQTGTKYQQQKNKTKKECLKICFVQTGTRYSNLKHNWWWVELTADKKLTSQAACTDCTQHLFNLSQSGDWISSQVQCVCFQFCCWSWLNKLLTINCITEDYCKKRQEKRKKKKRKKEKTSVCFPCLWENPELEPKPTQNLALPWYRDSLHCTSLRLEPNTEH